MMESLKRNAQPTGETEMYTVEKEGEVLFVGNWDECRAFVGREKWLYTAANHDRKSIEVDSWI
jgi:hypothetical protein